MKKLFALFAILLFSINLVGCQEISDSPVSTDSIEKVNYPVEVGQLSFDSAPKTVASLSPALTEIIYELGYGDLLIGRSSYCDYPEAVKTKTDIGSSVNPNIGEIIKLKPQILVSQSPIAKKDITKIEAAGVRVLILSTPQTFVELKQCYIDISSLFGGAINAQETAEKALIPLTTALEKAKSTGTFAYIMTYDLAVATGDTLSSDILSYFGTNIAKDNQKYTITTEELLAKQPDIIFLATPMNAANLPAETTGLNAIKNNKIISIDNKSFERPTSRLLAQMVADIEKALGITSDTVSTAQTTVAVITSAK